MRYFLKKFPKSKTVLLFFLQVLMIFEMICCLIAVSVSAKFCMHAVRSLSVSSFIEKELRMQLRMKRKRKGER